ncbi:hypothetical protein COPEUT_03050 [Coprococcus eutactus ATCC 27759]|nr:hypothetical protein COPEUT_03050 [Coprococcus eutactus ATCC 27759]
MSSALHNWKRTSIITVSNPCRMPEKQYYNSRRTSRRADPSAFGDSDT